MTRISSFRPDRLVEQRDLARLVVDAVVAVAHEPAFADGDDLRALDDVEASIRSSVTGVRYRTSR